MVRVFLRKIKVGQRISLIEQTAIVEFAALPLWNPNDKGRSQPTQNPSGRTE